MKNASIKVAMSAQQAARINNIAVMLQITPAELLATLAFDNLSLSDDEPYNFLALLYENKRRLVDKEAVPGADIEALLRGGLERLSLSELLKMADIAGHPCYDDEPEQQQVAWNSIDVLLSAGKKLLRQSSAA